jgi:hypothetical protein
LIEKQDLADLINEEAQLFAKYLRGEALRGWGLRLGGRVPALGG